MVLATLPPPFGVMARLAERLVILPAVEPRVVRPAHGPNVVDDKHRGEPLLAHAHTIRRHRCPRRTVAAARIVRAKPRSVVFPAPPVASGMGRSSSPVVALPCGVPMRVAIPPGRFLAAVRPFAVAEERLRHQTRSPGFSPRFARSRRTAAVARASTTARQTTSRPPLTCRTCFVYQRCTSPQPQHEILIGRDTGKANQSSSVLTT